MAEVWIELHSELPEHPKIFRLATLLGVEPDLARAKLERIWLAAMKYAPEGNLAHFTDTEIANFGNWKGDPRVFAQALRAAEWIDADGAIHDWHDYAGRFLDQDMKRKADRDRKRTERDAQRQKLQQVRLSVGRPRTRPELSAPTIPDLTVPDRTIDPPPEIPAISSSGAPASEGASISATPKQPPDVPARARGEQHPRVEAKAGERDGDPEVETLILERARVFAEHRGVKSGPPGRRERAALKYLLRSVPSAEVAAALPAFIPRAEEPIGEGWRVFAARMGWSWSALGRCWDELAAERSVARPPSAAEARAAPSAVPREMQALVDQAARAAPTEAGRAVVVAWLERSLAVEKPGLAYLFRGCSYLGSEGGRHFVTVPTVPILRLLEARRVEMPSTTCAGVPESIVLLLEAWIPERRDRSSR